MFKPLMDTGLEGLLGDRCLVYLDDIIIFGCMFGLCRDRLETVLEHLRGAGLHVKPSKCQLFQREVAFLGIWCPEKESLWTLTRSRQWRTGWHPGMLRRYAASVDSVKIN